MPTDFTFFHTWDKISYSQPKKIPKWVRVCYLTPYEQSLYIISPSEKRQKVHLGEWLFINWNHSSSTPHLKSSVDPAGSLASFNFFNDLPHILPVEIHQVLYQTSAEILNLSPADDTAVRGLLYERDLQRLPGAPTTNHEVFTGESLNTSLRIQANYTSFIPSKISDLVSVIYFLSSSFI